MDVLSSRCCVCLEPTFSAQKVTNWDNKNSQWITKLQNVVPEVVWLEHYTICKTCTNHLDIAYEFKALCSRLQNARTKLIQTEDTSVIQKCQHCNATFLDKEQLKDHLADCPHRVEEIKVETRLCDETEMKPPEDSKIDIEPMEFPEEVKIEVVQPQVQETKSEPRLTNELQCANCNKTYTTRKILKTHVKTCLRGRKRVKRTSFSCEVCNQVYKYAKQVVEHCITEHSMDRKTVKPFTCEECNARFTSTSSLFLHKKYHSGVRSYICSFCGKSFITKTDLTVHEQTHLNQRNYKCDICEKAYNTNHSLRAHKQLAHTDSSQWKYRCEVCGRRSVSKSNLEQHMKRHSGDKQFVCNVCSKGFVTARELRIHLDYHLQVKPFKCPHCDKAYRYRKMYELHVSKSHWTSSAALPVVAQRKYNVEKKFVCMVCAMAFRFEEKLEKHMKKHVKKKAAVKPDCQLCDMKFTNQHYLKEHLERVHDVKDVEDSMKVEEIVVGN